MTPSPKYAAGVLLYHLGGASMWEHHIFAALERAYPAAQLNSLREDPVGLSSLGWIDTRGQCEHRGRILRRYTLRAEARRVVECQLRVDRVDRVDRFDAVMRSAGVLPAPAVDAPARAAAR